MTCFLIFSFLLHFYSKNLFFDFSPFILFVSLKTAKKVDNNKINTHPRCANTHVENTRYCFDNRNGVIARDRSMINTIGGGLQKTVLFLREPTHVTSFAARECARYIPG